MLPDGMLETIMLGLGMHNISQRGDWTNASCPLAPYVPEHKSGSDKNPSFGIIQDPDSHEVRCNCYSCGYNGTLENLISRLRVYHRKDYDDLLMMVIRNKHKGGFPSWDKPAKKVDVAPVPLRVTPEVFPQLVRVREAVQYLKGRGITRAAVDAAQLRWRDDESRIVFPVFDFDKKLYGFTSRTTLKEADYPVDPDTDQAMPKVRDFYGLKKKRFILGAERWQKGKPGLVIEGLMGYAYLLSIGAETCFNVGATMGANMSDYQAEKLIAFGEPVYLLYDNDPAGQKGIFGIDGKPGAVHKLNRQIPLYLPKWPEREDGSVKDDPDQLTLDELEQMRKQTPLYIIPSARKRPVFTGTAYK